jgi:hypothetical protein
MNDSTIKVSGVIMRLNPYSEKRMKALTAVRNEISEWIDGNLDKTIDEVPIEKKADWWKRKADILWQPMSELPADFYASDDFESSQLKESEDFFIMRRMYL